MFFNQLVDKGSVVVLPLCSIEWLNTRSKAVAADPLSRVFSALADPTRRDMVARLAGGDATVNELADPYEVTVQAVSKHLKVLEDAGLVSRSRDAQRRPVHLEAEVFDLMTKWIERYRREAEERFRRLDDVLRSMPDDVEPTPNTPPTQPPKSPRQEK
jgi:DNA-binding transcriptional ArsR family regulator